MIPLLLTPHDWQVLDGNLPEPMISTRYATQNSCMGLCRKYYYLVKTSVIPAQAGTQWFAAKTTDGRLVGIATAYINPDNTCNVDGFIHKRFNDSYEALINAAIDWGTRQHALQFATRLSVEDEEKRALFEELGFRTQALDGTFTIADRAVGALTMLLN